ncbi:hypothetical protein [Rugamonas sp.]|uniref:hypothetical protein n=1 Tax=Rugamonas sp. TaxID=1926287 RepID=UPI0025DFDB84|nr:hypothetical protein [Rugamonas sp.]
MVLKTTTAAVAGMTGVLLSACVAPYSPVPLAANFPATRQLELQAANHWAIIAGNLEQHMVLELKKSPPRPLFLNEAPQPSPFARALAAQLTTSLVNDGYTVAKTPAGALKIDLDVQAVTFSANRPQYRYFGEHSALAAGVWVLSEIEPPALGVATAAVGAYDAYSWFNSQFAPGATPKTEIIVTVSVSDPYRYYARTSSAYYVSDSDRVLYGMVDKEPELPKLSKMYQVRGDK